MIHLSLRISSEYLDEIIISCLISSHSKYFIPTSAHILQIYIWNFYNEKINVLNCIFHFDILFLIFIYNVLIEMCMILSCKRHIPGKLHDTWVWDSKKKKKIVNKNFARVPNCRPWHHNIKLFVLSFCLFVFLSFCLFVFFVFLSLSFLSFCLFVS